MRFLQLCELLLKLAVRKDSSSMQGLQLNQLLLAAAAGAQRCLAVCELLLGERCLGHLSSKLSPQGSELLLKRDAARPRLLKLRLQLLALLAWALAAAAAAAVIALRGGCLHAVRLWRPLSQPGL
jgi:hypothetical protein